MIAVFVKKLLTNDIMGNLKLSIFVANLVTIFFGQSYCFLARIEVLIANDLQKHLFCCIFEQ
jgi:hypothetical protein